jgi:ribose transport system ATP-binding protein
VTSGGNPVVQLLGISKNFTGTNAVRHVDMDIFAGEVHGLVGENGAGKSTLMRVLAGIYPDYSGEILVDGRPQRISSPRQALGLGIAMVHQELSLVPELSVAANIFLGREPSSKVPHLISNKAAERAAKGILAEIEADILPSAKIEQLSIAQQQLVEIAKGLSTNSKLLILDEPTSSLTEPETKDLFRVIRTLKEKGVAVIYISHKLSEVFEIADRITVLRDGIKVDMKPCREWDEPSLVRAMVGRNLSVFFPKTHDRCAEQVALEVERLTHEPDFREVSFKLHQGEVIGLYGLVGSGRTELAMAIFGLSRFDSGRIKVNGRIGNIRSPSDAISCGIALVPEDRRVLGIISMLDVRRNLTHASLARLVRWGFIDQKKELQLVSDSIKNLNIRASSIRSSLSTLSGGNQQKVVLGKWLNTDPIILILDEPTRGIDVGAKAEIRSKIDRLAAEGKAILLISSELPEIIGMSDRVIVMRDGRMVGTFSGEEADAETIGRYAISKSS